MDNQELYLNSYSELLNSTISLLERGETEITLRDEYRDLVLILGDAGNDISFIESIAGDDSNATAIYVEKTSDEFINKNRQIGDFIIKYVKGCPVSLTKANPNELFYGCSCFSGGRSASVDIATTYITNKVLSHSDRIKIILTVNYSLLEKRDNREDFLKFLRHVSYFVKDIEKYRNSLAMIAIRGKEHKVWKDGDYILEGGIQIVKYIAEFLLKVRQHIIDKQKDLDISNKDKLFYENALHFINSVTEKDGEHYKKIGIFNELAEVESNNNIVALQESKSNIGKIIYDELSFTEKLNSDFKCRISKNSEQDINNLVEEINDVVRLGVKRLSATIHEYYQNQIHNLLLKLEYFSTGKKLLTQIQ